MVVVVETFKRPGHQIGAQTSKQGGGSGSGGNEDENFAGNFGGSHNVGTMFADANIAPNNDNTDMGGSWQSVLATACSEGFDVGDLLNPQ
ncbi:hypothetical protein HanPSC8_Chr05g0195561 [Helianthus annuus]|nr:hypothetical protein HanPSC8_Chr05g0195561 [Helianthus annuus]